MRRKAEPARSNVACAAWEGDIMKGVAVGGVCLALGLGLSQAAAQEPSAAAALGRPSAVVESNRRPIADAQIVLASQRPPAIAISSAVVRGKGLDVPNPFAVDKGLEVPNPFPVKAAPSLPEEPRISRNDSAVVPATGFAVDRPVMGWILVSNPELPVGPELSPAVESADCSGDLVGGAPPSRFYVRGEYLLWQSKAAKLPPLVTTGTPPDTNLPTGALGRPDTKLLFGGSSADYPVQSGARLTLGYQLDACRPLALETTLFFLGRQALTFDANSMTFPVLARPFFNLNLNQQDVQLTAFPGDATGSIHVSSSTQLWGAEANLRSPLCSGCWYHLNLLAGPRYLDLSEDLQIMESIRNITAVPGTVIVAGTPVTVTDRFQTRNQFIGGQLGAVLELHRGPWFLDLRGKLALGESRETVTITGNQVIGVPNALPTPAPTGVVIPGGLLALATNIGRFSQDRFSVVPEIGVNVGYQFTDQWRAFVGYDFLYWSNVLRPGDQIDPRLDAAFIPNFPMNAAGQPFAPTGLMRPTVPFKHADYWAQGLNVGVEFRY